MMSCTIKASDVIDMIAKLRSSPCRFCGTSQRDECGLCVACHAVGPDGGFLIPEHLVPTAMNTFVPITLEAKTLPALPMCDEQLAAFGRSSLDDVLEANYAASFFDPFAAEPQADEPAIVQG